MDYFGSKGKMDFSRKDNSIKPKGRDSQPSRVQDGNMAWEETKWEQDPEGGPICYQTTKVRCKIETLKGKDFQ